MLRHLRVEHLEAHLQCRELHVFSVELDRDPPAEHLEPVAPVVLDRVAADLDREDPGRIDHRV